MKQTFICVFVTEKRLLMLNLLTSNLESEGNLIVDRKWLVQWLKILNVFRMVNQNVDIIINQLVIEILTKLLLNEIKVVI